MFLYSRGSNMICAWLFHVMIVLATVSAFTLSSDGAVESSEFLKLEKDAVLPEHAVNKKSLDAAISEVKASIKVIQDSLYDLFPIPVTTHAAVMTPTSHLTETTFPPVAEGFSRFIFTSALTNNLYPALSAVIERNDTFAQTMVQRYSHGNFTSSYLAVAAMDVNNLHTKTKFQAFDGRSMDGKLKYPYLASSPTVLMTCNDVSKSEFVTHLWGISPNNYEITVGDFRADNHVACSSLPSNCPCANINTFVLNAGVAPEDPRLAQMGSTTGRTVNFSPVFESIPAVFVQEIDTNGSGSFCSLTAVSTSSASFICRYRDAHVDSTTERVDWFAFAVGTNEIVYP